jgi:hypothetical protein
MSFTLFVFASLVDLQIFLLTARKVVLQRPAVVLQSLFVCVSRGLGALESAVQLRAKVVPVCSVSQVLLPRKGEQLLTRLVRLFSLCIGLSCLFALSGVWIVSMSKARC